MRRKSCDLFKLVADKTERAEKIDEAANNEEHEKIVETFDKHLKMVDKVEKAEKAR